MEEERVVFDFTNKDILSLISKDSTNMILYNKYSELQMKGIKNYSCKEVDEKVIVSFVTETSDEYDCIYIKKSISDIKEKLKSKKTLDFQGCYFKNFDISKIKDYRAKIGELNVEYSFWEGDVNFRYAIFDECDVSFSHSIFGKGKIIFHGVEFTKCNLYFFSTNINKENISFEFSKFSDAVVDLTHSNFLNTTTSFDNAIFNNTKLEFDYSVVNKGDLSINWSKMNNTIISFEGTKYYSGKIKIYNQYPTETNIRFNNMSVDSVELNNTIYSSLNEFGFRKIKSLKIDNSTIEKIIKISGSPKELSLNNTANLGQIHFFDEPSVIVSAIEKSFKKDSYKNNKDKLDQLTLIKENYHQLGEYEGEDLAYRTYMKYKTKFMRNGITKFFYWLFGKIGKYGIAPLSIIIWMGIFFSAFAGAYFTFLFNQSKLLFSSIGNAFYFSGITFLTIGYGDISPLCGGMKILAVAEGFIGLFLMSYLTVAVVRKLLR